MSRLLPVLAGITLVGMVAFLALLPPSLSTGSKDAVDTVLVVKSERRLYLLSGDETLAEFRVSLGSNPKGHKLQEGDGRTPEGRYVLDYKNQNSAYYKSIHVSYPNAQDKADAASRKVSPGGDIMIHGQKNGWRWLSQLSQFVNWTDGCIALNDKDMDQVWALVPTGTPIEIRP